MHGPRKSWQAVRLVWDQRLWIHWLTLLMAAVCGSRSSPARANVIRTLSAEITRFFPEMFCGIQRLIGLLMEPVGADIIARDLRRHTDAERYPRPGSRSSMC